MRTSTVPSVIQNPQVPTQKDLLIEGYLAKEKSKVKEKEKKTYLKGSTGNAWWCLGVLEERK